MDVSDRTTQKTKSSGYQGAADCRPLSRSKDYLVPGNNE
jgi:hypothetical protein